MARREGRDKKLNGSNSVLEGKIHLKEKELAEENFKYLDLDESIFNFIKRTMPLEHESKSMISLGTFPNITPKRWRLDVVLH